MNKSSNIFLLKFIFLLALCSVINFISCQSSIAETITLLDRCPNNVCHKTPNSVVISSNGSFFIVLDSGDSTTNAFLRKVSFSSGNFIDAETIDLGNINPESTNLSLYLNNENSKALVIRKSTAKNKSLVLLVDLSTSKKTEVFSSLNLSSINFINESGSKLIAGTNDLKLLILDSSIGTTDATYNIDDVAKDINVTKDFKKAIIAYTKRYVNSIGVFDKELGSIKKLDLSGDLIFDVDDIIIRNSIDLRDSRSALSSFNGKHVFNLLDLKESKLKTAILDTTNKGVSTSDISPDGATAITASVVNNANSKIYKIDLRNNTIKLLGTKSISGFLAFDVNIIPDQQKVFILGLVGEKVKLKVYNLASFTEIGEYNVSELKDTNRAVVEPYGRYAVKPGASNVSVVTIAPTGTTGTVGNCGNGKIDAGEECDPKFDEMSTASKCNKTTCTLNCSGGLKSCTHGLFCSAGSGASKCGCICFQI